MSTTIIIIGITVAISMYAFSNHDILYKWMMNPFSVITKQQYFRFLTSVFIHSDYVHLGFNMLTLYFFGDHVEYFFEVKSGGKGTLIFVVFYLAAIVLSEVPTFLKHKSNPNYNSLGASGGVAAVVFSSIMIYPDNVLYISMLFPIPAFVFGILYLIYSYYMSKKGKDNINHDAHFYGAVFGILFTLVIDPGLFSTFFEQIGNFNLSGFLP